MPTCYRCGNNVPEGETECESCKAGMSPSGSQEVTPEEFLRQFLRFKRKFLVELDWELVIPAKAGEPNLADIQSSLLNIKKVFSTVSPMLPRNSPEHFALINLVKSERPGEPANG